MAFAGLRGTGDWATDERPKNFREMILWRQPNGQSPLTALMARMSSESVDDPEFNWWEEELDTVRIQVNGVMNTTTTTSVVVDEDALLLVPGDVLLVEKAETGNEEILTVGAVTSDTAFTVARGQAGTSAAAIPDDTYLTKIGNTYAEGSGSPSVTNRNPVKKTNYCQIFKTAYEITNTAKKTRTRTGDPLKNDKKRKMFDHSIAMEWAFIFGKPFETTGANGKPLRFTGGIRHYLSTNTTAFTTTPTETTFLNAVQSVFDYDSGAGNERIMFMGNSAATSLNKLAKSGSDVNMDEVVKVYGMQLQRWLIPQGTLYVRTHPLFNTHGRYTNTILVIDPSALRYRYMRDTKMMDNIQDNDADEQKGQWLSECGLELRHERTMAYLSNFVV